MSACQCSHLRSEHARNGVGRCTRPGCPCLYGPPPVRRMSLPARVQATYRTDADGVVQDFKKTVRESERTKLERMLFRRILEAGLPEPVKEWPFARAEGRRFRFDFAYVDQLLALEVEGGIWARDPGRHNRGSGFEQDATKYNLAAVLGWRVLRFTERLIRSGEAVDTIRRALYASAPAHQIALTGGAYAE